MQTALFSPKKNLASWKISRRQAWVGRDPKDDPIPTPQNDIMVMECCDHRIAGFLWGLLELVQAEEQRSTSQKGPAGPRWELMLGSQREHRSTAPAPAWISLSASTAWVHAEFRGSTAHPQCCHWVMHIPLMLDPCHSLKKPLQQVSIPWSWGGSRRVEMREETLPPFPSGAMGGSVAFSMFPIFHCRLRGIEFYVWAKHSGKKKSLANVCVALLPDVLQLLSRDLHRVPELDENDTSTSIQCVGGLCSKTSFFSDLNWNLLTGESIYTAGRFLCAKDQVKINVIRSRGKPGQSI